MLFCFLGEFDYDGQCLFVCCVSGLDLGEWEMSPMRLIASLFPSHDADELIRDGAGELRMDCWGVYCVGERERVGMRQRCP